MVINNDGRQASRWYSENFLQGNPSKYQAIIISNNSTQRDVEIDTFIVQPMDELHLLGVLIDMNLLFSNHISTSCKKAGMQVSVLMRMRNMISMKVKLRIQGAAILPYLTYWSLIWHFCRGSDRRKHADHHMMSYLRVHVGCLVLTIGACRISQSSCTKWNLC